MSEQKQRKTKPEKKKQPKKKGLTFGKLKVLILVGVLIYMGFTFVTQQAAVDEQKKRRTGLLAQQEELERQVEFKKSELDYIGSDEYIEQQARERLGWLKEDEILYVEGKESSPGQTDGAAEAQPKKQIIEPGEIEAQEDANPEDEDVGTHDSPEAP